MFNLAAGTDWFLNLIRTTVFPPMARFILSIDAVKKRFFPLISQIGITYRDGSLSDHDGDGDFEIKAGDRMPYFLIDGESIYDKLREPKFHLLTFTDGESDQGFDSQSELGGLKAAELIDHYVVPLDQHIAELFGSDKPFNVFLRPDNYVALISRDTSSSRVWAYLEDVVGMPFNS